MIVDLARFGPWVLTFGLAVALLRGPSTDRLGRWTGIALLASVCFTGVQLFYAEVLHRPNWWVGIAWPVVVTCFLVWAIVRVDTQIALTVGGLVAVMMLIGSQAVRYAGVLDTSLEANRFVMGMAMLSWNICGLVLVATVWHSKLVHDTIYERGIWLYHGLAQLPFAVVVMVPEAFRPAFVTMRLFQGGGLCLLIWWAWRRARSRVSRPSLTSSDSSVLGSVDAFSISSRAKHGYAGKIGTPQP